MSKNIFIVRFGEIALKGKNKPYFERILVEKIKNALEKYNNSGNDIEIEKKESLIFVRVNSKINEDIIIKKISNVFGVASISPVIEGDSNIESLCDIAVDYVNELKKEKNIKTFKIEAKRANKKFPIKSPEIAKTVGSSVLKRCEDISVDVHNPELVLYVEMRNDNSYVFSKKIEGFGGLPLGTNGKGMILLSGGIDSPVAAWMMAKRGMMIEAIHFHSYPYTSQRAQEKVEDLAQIIAGYCGEFKMHVVNLLPIQEEIVSKCPKDETTILVRRFMMKIAEKIANINNCGMLITGENLGQVASQTADSIIVTTQSVELPIMRPLIAFDKIDIMNKAKEIGTYETSILPYEDCCTVFLPKHPVTRPKIKNILKSESLLDSEKLINEAIASIELINIKM